MCGIVFVKSKTYDEAEKVLEEFKKFEIKPVE